MYFAVHSLCSLCKIAVVLTMDSIVTLKNVKDVFNDIFCFAFLNRNAFVAVLFGFFIPVLMAVTILISENNSFSCRSFFPTVMNLLTELSLYIVLHVRFVICINCYYYYYSLTVLSLMIQRCM